jgi:hypothetical protein
MQFAAEFPAWCDGRGFPRSWRHYVYGMAHLARRHMRATIALAEGVRLGNAVQDDFDRFARDVATMTEVPRNG